MNPSTNFFQSSIWAKLYKVYLIVKLCLVVLFFVWFAVGLFGFPALKHKEAGPFRFANSLPKTPEELARPEPTEAMLRQQERCWHIFDTNGLKNFYCPICRKKLRSGRSPWWQV